MICKICPHKCNLSDNEIGKCLVYQNINGDIKNIFSGDLSILSVEPIEKKPFFHFMPGQKVLSVGGVGCSLNCDFCFNYSVSQTTNGKKKRTSPTELVKIAMDKKVGGISFSYNEPTLYYDYIIEVAKLTNLPISVKSNGYISPEILSELSKYVKAWNIDIKGDNVNYKNVCKGELEHVLNSIKILANLNSHVEVSYLVLPDLVHDTEFNYNLMNFLGRYPNIPIHLLYFFPFHRMNTPSYPISDLVNILKMFQGNIKNKIYVSNSYDIRAVMHRNTYCNVCGDLMIDRINKIKVFREICCNQGV